MKQGNIFNIQKFSIHDGPGIRTTVFLKGCPLSCKWCANPESQAFQSQILWDEKKCVRCLNCIQSCPNHAISCSNDKIYIDPHLCKQCKTCVHTCLNNALSIEGEAKSIEEITKIVLQDKDFYEESNGGITLSGGEAMVQPDFVYELVQELKKHQLHIAIETTGFIPSSTFQKLAKEMDLLLFDVKHYDSNKHKQATGVNNELIIKNLSWAIQQGIEVLPRIPVIPNFNDSLEDAQGLADLLCSVHAKKVQLLPFHQFGQRKYEMLHRTYEYENVKALQKEDLLEYQAVFKQKGLDCFF